MQSKRQSYFEAARLLILGSLGVILVLGLVLIAVISARSVTSKPAERVNALVSSRDTCVVCHRDSTPGIADQYGHSTMAAAEVSCRDCHEVRAGYAGGVAHHGTTVLSQPTSGKCSPCHAVEVAQFGQSRHGLPAYVAYAGTGDLSPEQLAAYSAIPEGSFAPDQSRNALYELEGPAITRFACESCHDIGKPQPDGSEGECQSCHLRHEFSLEQARKPETCNACHIGPDHPQWEIYQESPHGIAYATLGHDWQWSAESGRLSVEDFPAATCAVCHISGFGASSTTHDVGDRLTWYLFAPVSERRPSWQENMKRMQSVCRECHSRDFIEGFYTDADLATEAVNDWVLESRQIIAPAQDSGLMTDTPFDQPIDFAFFNLWHHWGRTAKFGAWMQGPDYTQWHGAYEVLHELARLREMVGDMLDQPEAGD
jgi:hydroxylamine dehydrogenase